MQNTIFGARKQSILPNDPTEISKKKHAKMLREFNELSKEERRKYLRVQNERLLKEQNVLLHENPKRKGRSAKLPEAPEADMAELIEKGKLVMKLIVENRNRLRLVRKVNEGKLSKRAHLIKAVRDVEQKAENAAVKVDSEWEDLWRALDKSAITKIRKAFSATENEELNLQEFVITMSSITKDLFFCNGSLNLARIALLEDLFQRIDQDGSETMTWDEFTSFVIENADRVIVYDDKIVTMLHPFPELIPTQRGSYTMDHVRIILTVKNMLRYVTVGETKAIDIYNTDGTHYRSLEKYSVEVVCAISVDELGMLVTGSIDRCVLFWNTSTFDSVARVYLKSLPVALMWCSVTKEVVAACTDGTCVFIETTKRVAIAGSIKCHEGWIAGAVEMPESGTFATIGSEGSEILVWDSKARTLLHAKRSTGKNVLMLRYARDHRALFSICMDHSVTAWNPLLPYAQGRSYIHEYKIVFCEVLENSEFAISIDTTNVIRVWDKKSLRVLQEIELGSEFRLRCACYDHDKDCLICLDGRNAWWLIPSTRASASATTTQKIVTVLYCDHFNKIVLISEREISLWNVGEGSRASSFVLSESIASKYSAGCMELFERQIVAGHDDGTIQLLSLTTGGVTKHMRPFMTGVIQICFVGRPKTKHYACLGAHGEVCIIDLFENILILRSWQAGHIMDKALPPIRVADGEVEQIPVAPKNKLKTKKNKTREYEGEGKRKSVRAQPFIPWSERDDTEAKAKRDKELGLEHITRPSSPENAAESVLFNSQKSKREEAVTCNFSMKYHMLFILSLRTLDAWSPERAALVGRFDMMLGRSKTTGNHRNRFTLLESVSSTGSFATNTSLLVQEEIGMVVVGTSDGVLMLFSIGTLAHVASLQVSKDRVGCAVIALAYEISRNYLIASFENGNLLTYDMLKICKHARNMTSLQFLPGLQSEFDEKHDFQTFITKIKIKQRKREQDSDATHSMGSSNRTESSKFVFNMKPGSASTAEEVRDIRKKAVKTKKISNFWPADQVFPPFLIQGILNFVTIEIATPEVEAEESNSFIVRSVKNISGPISSFASVGPPFAFIGGTVKHNVCCFDPLTGQNYGELNPYLYNVKWRFPFESEAVQVRREESVVELVHEITELDRSMGIGFLTDNHSNSSTTSTQRKPSLAPSQCGSSQRRVSFSVTPMLKRDIILESHQVRKDRRRSSVVREVQRASHFEAIERQVRNSEIVSDAQNNIVSLLKSAGVPSSEAYLPSVAKTKPALFSAFDDYTEEVEQKERLQQNIERDQKRIQMLGNAPFYTKVKAESQNYLMPKMVYEFVADKKGKKNDHRTLGYREIMRKRENQLEARVNRFKKLKDKNASASVDFNHTSFLADETMDDIAYEIRKADSIVNRGYGYSLRELDNSAADIAQKKGALNRRQGVISFMERQYSQSADPMGRRAQRRNSELPELEELMAVARTFHAKTEDSDDNIAIQSSISIIAEESSDDDFIPGIDTGYGRRKSSTIRSNGPPSGQDFPKKSYKILKNSASTSTTSSLHKVSPSIVNFCQDANLEQQTSTAGKRWKQLKQETLSRKHDSGIGGSSALADVAFLAMSLNARKDAVQGLENSWLKEGGTTTTLPFPFPTLSETSSQISKEE
jgi:hypothetical protein